MVALSLTALFAASPHAHADRNKKKNPVVTPVDRDGTLSSRISLGGTGYTGGPGTQPITSSNANWSPPDCWYEAFTPDEFKSVIMGRYYKAGNDNAGTIYNYYYQVNSDMTAIKYHKGDKGDWWLLVYNPDLPPNTGGSCTLTEGWKWVKQGDPPPAGVITVEMLSQAAYAATKLPVHTVTLSPVAGNQKVNIPTYVSFGDPLPQVFVTAQIPNPPIAATVVARPHSLHIDAGTANANPQSCDYLFKQVGDSYTVNSADADCNITYTKATLGGSYPLKAQITWQVHWTASADPNGPAAGQLDDGYTTATQDVAVQEIQTVNRD
ncbi:hypothetical protein [Streptomyces sp. CA-111067]|uniref:hypothetical protein n=1 Tax=Streptomyces sp. CA-111067 TaxID=3240046 RepID=UPI003D994E2F